MSVWPNSVCAPSDAVRLRAAVVHGTAGPADVVIGSGRILAVEPVASRQRADHEFAEIAPGLVDWQVNGIDDADVWTTLLDGDRDRLHRLAETLLDQGVTSWCPTLVSAARPRYEQAFANAARVFPAVTSGARILGLHLEGPFLGRAPGAHRTDAIVAADHDFVDSLPPFVRVMTVAPEAVWGSGAIRRLVERGVVVSLGHSRPTREEFESAVTDGASGVTHLFNAMSGVHHREGGLAGWALVDPRLSIGLVADGVHVDPSVVALAFAAAAERIVLVSDQVAWRRHDGLVVTDGAPRRADGVIAGSIGSLLDGLVVCSRAGVERRVAVRAATANVARFVGAVDCGEIAAGRRADLVAFTDDGRLDAVWMDGNRVR